MLSFNGFICAFSDRITNLAKIHYQIGPSKLQVPLAPKPSYTPRPQKNSEIQASATQRRTKDKLLQYSHPIYQTCNP